MEIVVEFFLHLVAMERILVVFLRIQRKSIKEDCDRTGRLVVYRSLAKTSDEWLSRIHSISLQIERLQLTPVYCNRRRGSKKTPQKTRFLDVKCARIWDTEWVDDHSDKNTIDDTKHKINTKHNTKPNNVCSDFKQLGNTWECAWCYSLRGQSLFCCCHMHPLHIAHWLKIFAFASHSIPWSSPCCMHELSVLSWLPWPSHQPHFPPLPQLCRQALSLALSTSLRFSSKSPCALSPRRCRLMTITSPSQPQS